MLQIDNTITPEVIVPLSQRLFELSARKIESIEDTWDDNRGTPVFTIEGQYTVKGWTEWTQGFRFGSALLQYDATGDAMFWELGRQGTLEYMASHISHTGVHDHGFNNVSTYGNILRLIREGRVSDPHDGLASTCMLALKLSGAVQASRWTKLPDALGFIHSFNGSHSLFIDTMRSLRALALSYSLGHTMMGEQDRKMSLLRRLLQHAETTARYNIYWGESRDIYDTRGRTAHESLFNPQSGTYRCPSTQQGYAAFSTWTRGLAWAILGFAEQLEFLATLPDEAFDCLTELHEGKKDLWLRQFEDAALATADYYLAQAPTDGIPYWDTGAPGLAAMPGWREEPANPFNDHEPVDSSAAAIAAQGLLRLGHFFEHNGDAEGSQTYTRAALTIARTLFQEPYLSNDPHHQGLLLHSIYHRPCGWDHIPKGQRIPCGESSMWGDYHGRELALMIQRLAEGKPYYDFFSYLTPSQRQVHQ